MHAAEQTIFNAFFPYFHWIGKNNWYYLHHPTYSKQITHKGNLGLKADHNHESYPRAYEL